MLGVISRSAIAVALCGAWAAFAQDSAAALYKTNGGFGVRITVELKRDGTVRMVSPQSEFKNGDQIRLHFVSNVDGYVYALNETPSGESKVIFPTADTGSNNMVRKSQDYTIPATKGWFRMSGGAGSEKVLMILSPRALPEMESRLATPAISNPTLVVPVAVVKPVTIPASVTANNTGGASNSTVATTPASPNANPNESGGAANSTTQPGKGKGKAASSVAAANKDVSKVKSGVSLIGSIASIPKDVTHIPGLGSRDLVFEDDLKTGAAYVSSKPEGLTGPVIFSIALTHR